MDAAQRASNEKKIMAALLAVFGLTLAGSLKNLGLFGAPASKSAVVPAAPAPAVSAPAATTQASLQQYHERMSGMAMPEASQVSTAAPRAKPRYTAETLRDPMKSLLPPPPQAPEHRLSNTGFESQQPGASPAPPELRVQGVMLGSMPSAIINNKVYRVGESINGAKIVSIERQGVVIEFNGVSTRYTTSPTGKGR